MKELSIEEKAKAYNEALERAKSVIEQNPLMEYLKKGIEYIFPELKESEDEKIRKVLIDYFKRYKEHEECGIKTFYGIPTDDILAWLEKQDKKELVNFDEAEKEKSDFVGDGFIKCFANFLDFKEGETYWLEYIGDDKYNVRSDNLLGKTYHITPYQLYTVFKKLTWLEKQVENNPYSGVSFKYNGHTWGMCARDNGVDILLDKQLFKHLEKQGEQKTTWSVEDMFKVQRICKYLDEAKKYYADITEVRECIDWLKSLRPQNTWKPSDEQMRALHNLNLTGNISYAGQVQELINLYNDLKKLSEE